MRNNTFWNKKYVHSFDAVREHTKATIGQLNKQHILYHEDNENCNTYKTGNTDILCNNWGTRLIWLILWIATITYIHIFRYTCVSECVCIYIYVEYIYNGRLFYSVLYCVNGTEWWRHVKTWNGASEINQPCKFPLSSPLFITTQMYKKMWIIVEKNCHVDCVNQTIWLASHLTMRPAETRATIK